MTGAGGFVGAWTVARLVERGIDAIAALRDPGRPSPLLARLDKDTRAPRIALPEDRAALTALVEARSIDTVLHLAGQSQVGAALDDPPGALRANAGLTATLLEGARRAALPPSIVVASTDGVYGAGDGTPFVEDDPIACATPYEASKAAAELMARAYAGAFGLPVTIARFGNLYGPGDANGARIVPGSVRRALRGEGPVLRDGGTSERAYLFVADAVEALLVLAGLAARAELRGEAFNVSGSEAVTTGAMMRAILDAVGRSDLELRVEPAPEGGEISRKRSSSRRLTELTGWRPRVALAEGLRRTVAWERRRDA